MLRSVRYLLTILFCIAVASPASADSFLAGTRAASNGDFAKAYQKWSHSSDPRSFYMIGSYATNGQILGCDLNCAADWFRKAIALNHVPSLTGLGVTYIKGGNVEVGIELLNFSARWNDMNAKELLPTFGHAVPSPDLWNDFQEKQAALVVSNEKMRRQQQDYSEIIAPYIGYFAGCIVGGPAGCPGSNFSYQHQYEQLPDTPPNPQNPLRRGGGQVTCANGTVSNTGICPLQPTTGPRMAPNGTYVGGNGNILLCPNGKYVSGRYCQLAPDGSYVGAP